MAARFWVGGGSSANWSATTPTNWSATSGGSNNATVPGASDDVTFDGAGASGNTASTVSGGQNVLSLTFSSGYTNTVTINTGVVLQVAAGGSFTDNTAHSWTVNGTGQLVLLGACTINSGGKTFPGAVQFAGTTVIKTLSVDWTVTGTLTVSGTPQTINGNILNLGAGFTAISKVVSGTTKLVFNGTGTIDTSSNGSVANNIDINTAGTITVALLNYLTGTLRLVAVGTLVGTSLVITGSCTLDIAGATWTLITFGASGVTVTLNSLITATQLAFSTVLTTTITFAGSFGWTCNTFNSTNNGFVTITLVNGNTYTVTDTFTCVTAPAASNASNKPLFTSNDGTLRANLILLNASSTCNVVANFTRINAAGGRPIVAFNGIITDCINVDSFSTVLFKPTTSFKRGGKRFGLTNKNKSVIYQ